MRGFIIFFSLGFLALSFILGANLNYTTDFYNQGAGAILYIIATDGFKAFIIIVGGISFLIKPEESGSKTKQFISRPNDQEKEMLERRIESLENAIKDNESLNIEDESSSELDKEFGKRKTWTCECGYENPLNAVTCLSCSKMRKWK